MKKVVKVILIVTAGLYLLAVEPPPEVTAELEKYRSAGA